MNDFEIEFGSLRESHDIECKAAQGQDGNGEVPKDFWESYSAMANTDGGSIFLGVQEKDNQFKCIGIKNLDKVTKELVDTANNRSKVSVNLIENADIIRQQQEGVTIIQVKVRRATRKERPVYLKNTPMGNSYRRRHEADQRMNDDEVKRMLADQQHDSLDHRVLKGFDLSDLDQNSLKLFQQAVATRSPEIHFDELSTLDFLKQVGGWRKDRETGQDGLTVAGLLMFGSYQMIRDEFPHYFVDYQEREEITSDERYLDRVCPDPGWSGNLYDFYRKVYPKLVSDLKVKFQLKNGVREGESPAHVAIREAFVNTLVHADYSIPTSIEVLKCSELFGFKNPGLMRVPLEIAMAGGESDSRNKSIQDMFRMIGAGERQGHGIRKIVEGWKQFDWRLPHFEEQEEPSARVVVTLSMLSLFPKQAVNFLNLRFGMGWNRFPEVDKIALILAYTERVVSHQRLSQFSSLHTKDITDCLMKLEGEGFLSSTGRYRAKTYHLPGQILPSSEEVFKSSPNSELNSPNSEPNSPNSEPNSPNSEPNSPNSEPNSPISELTKDKLGRILHPYFSSPFIDDLSTLELDYREQLEKVAEEPRDKKRISPEKMQALILEICSEQYVTIRALSDILQREAETLRGQYVTILKNDGKLAMAFPRTPNDPKQAYITVE